MRIAIAGAGSGRSFHRRRARRKRPRGHAASTATPANRRERHRGGRVGAGRRLRGASLLEAARLQTCDVVIAAPATTRSTWWSPCWPRPSSRSAGWSAGSTTRERVAVHRRLGRRRRGVHAAHPGRPGRGGGDGRRPGPAVHLPPGPGQPGRGHPAETPRGSVRSATSPAPRRRAGHHPARRAVIVPQPDEPLDPATSCCSSRPPRSRNDVREALLLNPEAR